MPSIQDVLIDGIQQGASDVHLVPGLPPMFRISTILAPAAGYGVIAPQMTEAFVREIIGPKRFEDFLGRRDADFSTEIPDQGRFRVNAHFQHGAIAVALRTIEADVPAINELNLPSIVESLIGLPKGLVLITGPTGSGKTTTLASMISEMNHRYQYHIITMEDPVEYELRSGGCVIEQREVGIDVPNFASGLRHALRQDPDIILVGEMRDLETISSAITAAETGHLVLSTLHTASAAQTVERIVDVYPTGQQNQIRSMLSNTLQAVVSMILFRRVDAPGMVPACEVMICTPAVRNCIRENRIHEIPNIIVTGRNAGMCTMQDAIRKLHQSGKISSDQAAARGVELNAAVAMSTA